MYLECTQIKDTPCTQKEYTLFEKYFSKLIDIVTDIDTLLPYFVSKRIIKPQDIEVIMAKPRTSERVYKLLMYIEGPLRMTDSTSFHDLLDIMSEHGIITTKKLAATIKGILSLFFKSL